MFPAAGSKKNRKSEERQVNIFTALTVFYTVCVCVELKIQTYQQWQEKVWLTEYQHVV